jgi:peptidoglycan hydrolase-like protein with peptidoglycan-binding domain
LPHRRHRHLRQQKVAQLQTQLNAAGAQLTVDGKMGPATRAALRDFQKAHHLKVTGRPDAATMRALGG